MANNRKGGMVSFLVANSLGTTKKLKEKVRVMKMKGVFFLLTHHPLLDPCDDTKSRGISFHLTDRNTAVCTTSIHSTSSTQR
mmetsp:Transcript_32440/g.50795  ORF Transcript_32440/g.50795 Transcript_32440/m.50795 type:complete len:82 (+) Transcript_32440:116-361(+)